MNKISLVSLWEKLLADSTTYLIANMIYAISLLGSSIYLTQNISLGNFGKQAFLYSIISLLTQITMFGQGGYNLLFGKEKGEQRVLSETFLPILIIFTLSSLVFFIHQYIFLEITEFEFFLILITLLSNSLSLVIYPLIISLKKNKLLILLKLVQSISLIISVYLIINKANSDWHPYSRIISIMISSFIIILITVCVSKKSFKYPRIYEVVKRIKFGLKLVPHIILGTLLITGDKYYIQYRFGEEDLGIYNLAFQLSAPILFLGTAINQSYVTNILGVDNTKNLVNKYITPLVVVILSVFYQLLIFSLFTLKLFSEKYNASFKIFIVLSFATLVQSLYMNESSKLLSSSNPLKQSLISFLVFVLILILILTVKFSSIYTFSYSIVLIWFLMYSFTRWVNFYAR